MRQKNKYDVFISSKSEDYHFAEEVYKFLTANGLIVFIASEELKKIGEAQYADTIDDVLDNSTHMIVVASTLSHIKSKWVKYEWSIFSNDLKSGYRNGNLLTILSNNIELRTLPASLRHQQSFHFESYKDEILDYLQVCHKDENHIQQPIKKQSPSTTVAVFKFYSNENCHIILDGKTIASVVGMSDEPYYFPVSRKGDYRFKCINSITAESIIQKEHIDIDEEKEIDIKWAERKPFVPELEWPNTRIISGDKFTVDLGGFCFNLIRVEGGDLEIGATKEQCRYAENNEYPAHNVSLQTFYIGEFPITQHLWEIVMGYNKSYFKNKKGTDVDKLDLADSWRTTAFGSVIVPWWTLIGGVGNRKKRYDKGLYPAEQLTYDEAQEFVRRLSKMTNLKFDLPTEDEWEYAARGGQKSKHFRYAGSDNIDEVAWYRGNSGKTTHPVGEKRPNELGLYDMSGNVWEWTKTPVHSYGSAVDSQGYIFIRRGGSWWHEEKNCRVSRRYASDHTKKTRGLGLRVVIRENIE